MPIGTNRFEFPTGVRQRPTFGSPYGGGGGTVTQPAAPQPTPNAYTVNNPASLSLDEAAMKRYRSDLGTSMTDAEYQSALRQREEDDFQRQLGRQVQTAERMNQIQQPQANAMAGLMNAGQDSKPSAAPGGGTVSSPAYEAQQQALLQSKLMQDQMQLENQYRNEASQRRLQAIQGISGQGGLQAPQVQHPAAGLGGNEAQARAAAFGRAKDLAGQNALGALRGLQSATEGRGLMGSTLEGNMIADVVGGAQGSINDFITQQLVGDLNRAADISDMQYQGGITQRGQDLSRQQALLGLLAAGGLY